MDKSYYLKHQITAWHDPRIQTMVKEEGVKAYGVYWYIIEKLSLLPTPKAQLTYMKPFAEKGLTYNYIMKIITKFGLFKIEGDYFSSTELNSSSALCNDTAAQAKTGTNGTKNEEKHTKNKEKSANHTAFSQEKPRFLEKTAIVQQHKNKDKKQLINNLKANHSSLFSYYNRITTTITKKEKEKNTAADIIHSKNESCADQSVNPASRNATNVAVDVAAPCILSDSMPVRPVKDWQELLADLDENTPWGEMACMKSNFCVLLKQHFKAAVEYFKNHIILYNKGPQLMYNGDIRPYFVNFIKPGSHTADGLKKHLQQLDKASPLKTNPYRYERVIDGKRTYNGQLIPNDAPPRPDEESIWNDSIHQWVSIRKRRSS